MEKQTRREVLKKSGSALAGLMAGLPGGWVGGAYTNDAPETKDVRFGIIALTDCSPIIMAHELGYFKKFGVNSVVSKEASWAVFATRSTWVRIRRRTC
jgi:ABC-type nitrate/sulfonate/bicarbonate transport systems, periplasmic components